MRTATDIRPILSALRAHRAAACLLALEIALTLAVLCNLVHVVSGTIRRAGTPSGVPEADIGLIQSIGVIGTENPGTTGGSLAALGAVPGVEAAAFGAAPFWADGPLPLFREPGGAQVPVARAHLFLGSQGLDRALDVRVIEGRALRDDELPSIAELMAASGPVQAPALITRALAARAFPDGTALGRHLYGTVYGTSIRFRIVGVIDSLRAEITGRGSDDESLLTQMRVGDEGLGGLYVVRSAPGRLSEVLPQAARAMREHNPGHVQQRVTTVAQSRERAFRGERATAAILVAIMAIVLLVTALGIGGLASFWVQQRTRQIGVRRALGATRGDILRYFQVENLLIVGAGTALGTALAFAINQWLMQRFELERLDPATAAAGALAVCVLGQLAVLGPALRAAAVPPAVATRSA
ncbi:ABC transporter permease [Luteimonas huabeiensis]|uniref:ABC transporter permease n=1 Tax=Luteimonas huabeiensis TaxID=1244513 RepID=UPI000467A014|nr:FtsX-like permease family protein [Luteimonas huabeiensis]